MADLVSASRCLHPKVWEMEREHPTSFLSPLNGVVGPFELVGTSIGCAADP